MNFTNDWTQALRGNLRMISKHLPKSLQDLQCLEIGSFEGKSAIMILDHLPNSHLTCIDPWDDAYVKDLALFSNWDKHFIGQYDRFLSNTKAYSDRITSIRGKSSVVMPTLESEAYDFVYIDGDHSEEAVYQDAIQAYRVCEPGGIILFDDYKWTYPIDDRTTGCTGTGIDKMVSLYSANLDIILCNWQLGLKKKSS